MAVPLCLILSKAEHTPQELRSLCNAPFIDASRVVRREKDHKASFNKFRSPPPAPKLDELTDDELLAPGTYIHSHTIAHSTRSRFEKDFGIKLPVVTKNKLVPLMQPLDLKKLMKDASEDSSDVSVSSVHELLKMCSKLKFHVAWCEDFNVEWLENAT